MAFSATVRGTTRMGGSTGMNMTFGDWSGSVGDAAGTVTVSGGKVWGTQFWKQDGDSTTQIFPRVDTSTSGSITTLTIQNMDNVVNGTFIIHHGGA